MTTNITEAVNVSTWLIDPSHSTAHFKVRHMAIAWVRGDFRVTKGTLRRDDSNMTASTIEVDIDAGSLNTNEPQRDQHLRSEDFLDTQRFPNLHFQSTNVAKGKGDTLIVTGNLTIHGVTRPIDITVEEISPATADPWGNTRIAVSATAKLNRRDFGLTWNQVLEAGGLLVGEEVVIDLEVEFLKATI